MTVNTLIQRVADHIVDPLILLLFAWGFMMFLWGLFEFVYSSDDLTAKANGKRHMLYGIIGMTVMVAAEGIVQILNATVHSLQ